MNKYVDCSKVYIDILKEKGYSVFAKQDIKKNEIIENGVLRSLLRFIEDQQLEEWLIKFDVILNRGNYVVLDVGLDRPFRMLKEATEQGNNFYKYYIEQYINNQIIYPLDFD